MTETRTNYSVPEPPPIATDEPAIIDLVIEDIEIFEDPDIDILIPHLRDRKAFGIAKYGTPLQVSNGRDHRPEGLQELQDFVAYMKQGLLRGDSQMRTFYYQGLVMAADLARITEGGEFDYDVTKKTVINPQ